MSNNERLVLRALAGFLLAPALLSHAAAPELGCPAEATRQPGGKKVGECHVEIAASPDGACRVAVTKGGAAVFDETGPSFVLEAVSGKDVDSDDSRDVVLRARGKERRFAYRVVACDAGKTPLSFENDYPAKFEKTSRGRRVFLLPDDGFRGFPDLPESDLLGESAPETRLMIQEGKLVDVGHEYRAHYDQTIREIHDSLSGPTIRKFKAGKMENEDDRKTVAAKVVKIAGSYLESGREEDAFRELKRMWPEGDYERVKAAMLAAIAKGTAKRIAVPPSD